MGKIKKVEVFQTTDDTKFDTLREAQKHQMFLDFRVEYDVKRVLVSKGAKVEFQKLLSHIDKHLNFYLLLTGILADRRIESNER
jgi:hypothetical protein